MRELNSNTTGDGETESSPLNAAPKSCQLVGTGRRVVGGLGG